LRCEQPVIDEGSQHCHFRFEEMFSAQANAIHNQCAGRVRSFRGGGRGGCESACEKKSEHWVPLSSAREFGGQTDVASAEAKQTAVGCEGGMTACHTLRVRGFVLDGIGCALLALALLEPLESLELVIGVDAVGRRGIRCGRCLLLRARLFVPKFAGGAELASVRCVVPPAHAWCRRSAGWDGFTLLQAGDGVLHPAGARFDRVQGGSPRKPGLFAAREIVFPRTPTIVAARAF
jgi:hypothetical protein